MKYAALCGVGNSAAFLRNNGGSLASLVAGHSPEQVAGPIEAHLAAADDTAIVQLHVFPFGGFEKASEWLRERGSWSL
jgi:methylenetetrahydrofolate reductase (NADPH)